MNVVGDVGGKIAIIVVRKKGFISIVLLVTILPTIINIQSYHIIFIPIMILIHQRQRSVF